MYWFILPAHSISCCSGLIACSRATKLQKWIDYEMSNTSYKNYGRFLAVLWKNGRQICVLDSSNYNSLTDGVVAGSSQNQCQELLLLVEIVNLLVWLLLEVTWMGIVVLPRKVSLRRSSRKGCHQFSPVLGS